MSLSLLLCGGLLGAWVFRTQLWLPAPTPSNGWAELKSVPSGAAQSLSLMSMFSLQPLKIYQTSAGRPAWAGKRRLGQEDLLEKEMTTHSSTLACRIPWTEEPGGYSPQGRKSWTRLSH